MLRYNYLIAQCCLFLCTRVAKHPTQQEHILQYSLKRRDTSLCDSSIFILAPQPDSSLGLLCCLRVGFAALLGGEMWGSERRKLGVNACHEESAICNTLGKVFQKHLIVGYICVQSCQVIYFLELLVAFM